MKSKHLSHKKIFFAYPFNRENLLKEVKTNTSPDNALYGLNHLNDYGLSPYFKDVSPKLEKALDILFSPLHRIFLSHIDIDFKLGRALLMLPYINNSDVVITATDGIGLPICLLKKIGLVKPPVIYTVGLFYIKGKSKKSLWGNKDTIFTKFYKWIISSADHITYHSPIEKEKLERLHQFSPERCTFVPMGSDEKFFRLQKEIQEDKLIVSVGKDRSRDYKTLINAAKDLKEYKFVIICRKNNIKGLEIPTNVKVFFDIPYGDVARFYSKAYAVVIPNREMARSSGQMTLTDSLQSSKPVIITSVKGISHYPLQNNINALLVPPQDSKALKKAIEKISLDKRLRSRIIKNAAALSQIYTTKNYSNNLFKIIDWVCSPCTIKAISEQDLEFIRKIRNKNKDYFIGNEHINKKIQRKWYQNYVQNKNDFMFVLKSGKLDIGMGAIYNVDEKNKSAEIGRFVINNKFQGQGYGKILLEKIEDVSFNKMNLKKIKLEVLKNNQKAIKLYEKAGFIRVGETTISGKTLIVFNKVPN